MNKKSFKKIIASVRSGDIEDLTNEEITNAEEFVKVIKNKNALLIKSLKKIDKLIREDSHKGKLINVYIFKEVCTAIRKGKL